MYTRVTLLQPSRFFRVTARLAWLVPFTFLLHFPVSTRAAELLGTGASARDASIGAPVGVTKKVPRPTFRSATTADGVVLTARSLFLNQELSSYVLADTAFSSAGWWYGSLIGGLRLDPQTLRAWQGKRVLDVAGGASILADEAVEVLGATSATVVDFNMSSYQRRMVNDDYPAGMIAGTPGKNREAAVNIYGENSKALSGSGLLRSTPWSGSKEEWVDLLDRVVSKESATGASYFNSGPTAKVSRLEGNVLKLAELVGVNQFDVTINSWMMMYLNEPNRIAAIIELIRVTKPAGQIRIQGGEEEPDGGIRTGYTGEQIDGFTPAVSAKRFAIWFAAEKGQDGTYTFRDLVSAAPASQAAASSSSTTPATPKRVRINQQSTESLLVLDVL